MEVFTQFLISFHGQRWLLDDEVCERGPVEDDERQVLAINGRIRALAEIRDRDQPGVHLIDLPIHVDVHRFARTFNDGLKRGSFVNSFGLRDNRQSSRRDVANLIPTL